MRRLFAVTTALACAIAAPMALAEGPQCEDWWFARNLILDRAGQCFATPLGQALFDNSDCVAPAEALSPKAADIVAQIRALEAEHACAVDTTRRALDDPGAVAPYRQMEDIPVRDIAESGCIGYRGARLELVTGARPDAAVIGWLEPGMSVGLAHFGRDGYDYIQVFPNPDTLDGAFAGWALIGPALLPCDGYAG